MLLSLDEPLWDELYALVEERGDRVGPSGRAAELEAAEADPSRGSLAAVVVVGQVSVRLKLGLAEVRPPWRVHGHHLARARGKDGAQKLEWALAEAGEHARASELAENPRGRMVGWR